MKVFFPTYGGGHVNAIIPIVKEMINKGLEPVILALTTSTFELDKHKIDYLKISDFLHLYSDKERCLVNDFGLKYSDALTNNKLSRQDTLDYLGVNLYDLSIRDSRARVVELYIEKGRGIFFPIDFVSRVLDEIEPDCVFVTCGQRMEKAMAVVASEKNIKVYRLVDLIGDNTFIEYSATVFVMNEIARVNIIANNKHIDNVFITGNPNFDYIPQCCNPLSFIPTYREEQLIVSVFTQPGISGLTETIGNIYKISSTFENITFILKPHPNEDLSDYVQFSSNNFILLENADANEIIEHSNLVITFFSSVGFQTINQDIPLVVLNFSGDKYPLDYAKYDCALKITCIDDYASFMRTFSQNRFDFTKFVCNYEKLKQPSQSVKKIISYIN